MAENWSDLGTPVESEDWSDLGARTNTKRFTGNVVDSLARSGLGDIARRVDPTPGRFTGSDVFSAQVKKGGIADRVLGALGINVGSTALTDADKAERERVEKYEKVSKADPFYQAPGGVLGKTAAGASTLAGQFVGAALSPENWVAPGKTVLTRAAGNAAIGGATDALLQGGRITTGVQDEYSPLQTGGAAAAGGSLSLLGDALGKVLGRKAAVPKTETKPAANDWSDLGTKAPEVAVETPIAEVTVTPKVEPVPEPVVQPAPIAEVVDDIPIPSKPTPIVAEAVVEPVAPTVDLNDKALDLLRSRQPVKVDQGPTLMEFLAKEGGVDDLGGELKAADADIWHRQRPFQPRFVKEGGRTLGDAAVLAQEAGFLPERVGDGDNRATPADLLNAIRSELSGSPKFAREDLEGLELQQRVQDLDEMAGHLGLDIDNMTNAEVKTAIDDYFRTPASRSGTAALKPLPEQKGPPRKPVTVDSESFQKELAEARRAAREGYVETRGQGQQYHGARGPIETLSEGYSNPDNIYGGFETFYTTDAQDVAAGYGRKNPNAVMYQVAEKQPVNFFDMEQPLNEQRVSQLFGNDDLAMMAYDEAKIEHGGEPNLRQVMDMTRDLSRGEMLSKDEVQGIFDTAIVNLQNEGFGGMRHIGGLKTGRAPHEVKIYLKPHEQVGVKQIQPGRTPPDPAAVAKLKELEERIAQSEKETRLKAIGERLASTKGELRERPRAGAVAAPDPKNLPVVEKNIGDLSRDLIKDLGLTARQGRLGMRGAMGTFNTRTGVTRTKGVQEMDVLSHEGGHALESKKLPSLQAAFNKHDTELAAMAYPGAAPNVLREEGFAEFFRWYLTNRTHAQKVAPKFYADFEAALAKDAPETLAKLQAVQAGYQTFLNSPSAAAAAASVVRPRKDSLVNKVVDFAKDPVGSAKALADDIYRGTWDRQNPVKRAVEELVRIKEKNTGQTVQLKTTENPYRLMRSLPGVAGAGHMDIMHGVHPYQGLDPDSPGLADALETALGAKWGKWDEKKIDEFGAYLIARRSTRLYDRLAEGKLDQPPDKFSQEFWDQAILDLEAGNPTWAKAAQMVYDWNNALWKKRKDGGLITDEQYQDGLTDHPDYVPLFRDMSDKDSVPGARGNSTKNAGGVNRLKGSTRDYVNPINSLMQQAYELNMLLARNDALKALDDLGQTAGPDAGSIVERIPAKQMKAINVDAIEAIKGALKDQGISGRDAIELQAAVEAVLGDSAPTKIYRAGEMNEKGEPIVYVWRNGKQIPLRLADGKFGRDMLEALAGMTPPLRGLAVDLASIPARALRYGITSHPSFFLANSFRDQLSAAILTDVGYLPFWDQFKGLSSELTQSELSRIYNVMGGEIGGAQSAAERSARLDQDIQAARKKGYAVRRFFDFDDVMKLDFAKTVKGVSEFTELSETGTRLGIFDRAFTKAKKAGMSEWEAAKEAEFEARDYLDFDRRGAYPGMQAAVRVIPFLNASLQALDKTRRVAGGILTAPKVIKSLFGGPPATEAETRAFNHAVKAWTAMSALAVGSLALRAANKDDPEYQEVADYVRNTAWVVKLPTGEFAAIPKPFDLAALSNVMERAYERVALDDPTAWDRLGEGLKQMFVPPDSPPVLGIPFELAKNRDNFGSPIVPDHLLHSVEPEDQYSDATSELSKKLGSVLGFSPAQIDHVLKGLTGSWGRDALKASDKAARGAAPVDTSLADTFVASRFVKDYTRGAVSSKEFWDLVSGNGGEWTSAEGSVRKLMNEGKTDEAIKRVNDMEGPERAYVMMSMFGESEEKQIHPLLRAQKAMGVISDLMTDLKEGNVRGVDLQPIDIDKGQRTKALDLLAKLSVAEKRNSLIDSGVDGWSQKEPLPRDQYVAELQTVAPEVLGALGIRMSLEGVADPNQTVPVWRAIRSGLESEQAPETLNAMMTAKLGKGKAAKERFLRETVPVR